jgi:hypothetical protein
MTDRGTQTRFGLRQWIELLLGAAALTVSAVSLWVAVGTEDANRQMVAAASWPLLQVDSGNVADNGSPDIAFQITNGGVGPAKLKTVEVWWHGKAYTGIYPFLKDCCGYEPSAGPADLDTAKHVQVITSSLRNVVILAGEKHTFFHMPLGPDNAAAWRKLDRARRDLKFRACYCSVFDECWISTLKDLEPQRVDSCPAVKVQYVE